ncbi:fungal specific transcription factor domain-containing protein [Anaeramoeba flamelloides]|uniref:Fungal specific transcription factor domain-containing protein n=1 Tax=Anaeramoeba flamelloides TaxID=1746091 RepID=A0ABQ8ZAW8_9EUKA|nr:fungal specific transcription factor domain-containing protein [Anaeramoeba flamelloides]
MSRRNLISEQNSHLIQRSLFFKPQNNKNTNFQEYPPLYPKKFSNQLIFHLQLSNKKDYLNLFPQQNSLHLKTEKEDEDEDCDGDEENKIIQEQQKKQVKEKQIDKVTTLNTNTLTKEQRISCYKNFILKTKICRSEHGIFGVHLNSKDYRINYQFNNKSKFQQKQLTPSQNQNQNQNQKQKQKQNQKQNQNQNQNQKQTNTQPQTKLDLQTNPTQTQKRTRRNQNLNKNQGLLRSLPHDWNKWTRTKRRTWLAFGTNNNLFYLNFNHPGQELKVGMWTQEEEEVFLKRCKEFGVNRGWGLFSQAIQGRIGKDCLDHFKLKLKNDTKFFQEYNDKYRKHKANPKRARTKPKSTTNRIGERKRKAVDPNFSKQIPIDRPNATNTNTQPIKQKRKSSRLRSKQILKSQGITNKINYDKLALQTLSKQSQSISRNLVPITFTENEIMTRKTLLNKKFQEFEDLTLTNIDPLKEFAFLKQWIKEEEEDQEGVRGAGGERIMKNFELNEDYDDEFSFTDEEEEEFEEEQEEEIKKNENENENGRKLNTMAIGKTQNEKIVKANTLTNNEISSNLIFNQDRNNGIQGLQTKKSNLQNIIYQNVEFNFNVPTNRNKNKNKNLNDQNNKALNEKNIDPNQKKKEEEEEQYLNPLPGLLDYITGVEIKAPCLSATGYVLDQTTWEKELKKNPPNICPFTKAIIQPQSLILLTSKNISQYLPKILNLDFNKLNLLTKEQYLEKKN